jgi:hypothetical protein
MAKAQKRGNRELKKPKATKKPFPANAAALQQLQGKLTPPKGSAK